jgi:hypothetical protein
MEKQMALPRVTASNGKLIDFWQAGPKFPERDLIEEYLEFVGRRGRRTRLP